MIPSLLVGAMLFQNPQVPSQPERTIFQTHREYADRINLRSDVAVVYGFDATMPARVKSWRDRGYKVHLMTGVAWGDYQDYYYGRFDGVNHEDEAQTRANGEKVGHGGDVYYMSPGINYGKYLATGVIRAMEAGVEAIHLEEPEFWSFGGYGGGFKREWQDFYHEPWQDPASTPDARWRAAKLMYYLYRRALQQVFASVADYNRGHGTKVRCYVPTHSLLNYAHWGIVSPESSLARIEGCDGYIAQVWTGTARTRNVYQGLIKERTFETAFLEYGVMQNLVKATGRGVWYLADPIEDDASHDWGDYRRNYESTLVASLLQPDVSQYEVMPWPERIFFDKYPSEEDPKVRVPIPGNYAKELQVVIRALNDMKQPGIKWEAGSTGLGVLVSDSLMFQRGGPERSDDNMSHVYGLALPFVKRGFPVAPVQLENATLPTGLAGMKVLLLTYQGQKPMTPDVHEALARWVRGGGVLVVVDDDRDPFNGVREWWNEGGLNFKTPREHLFKLLNLPSSPSEVNTIGRGKLVFLKRSPSDIAYDRVGDKWLADHVKAVWPGRDWKESSSIVLERGPYVIAAGLNESTGPVRTLKGAYIDLFDHELDVQNSVELTPGSRKFLVNLDKFRGTVIACGGAVRDEKSTAKQWSATVEGISDTPGVLVLRMAKPPKSISVNGRNANMGYNQKQKLLWVHFANSATPQEVVIVR